METSLKVFLNNYTEMNFNASVEDRDADQSRDKYVLFRIRTPKSELTNLISAGMKCWVNIPGNKPFKGIIKDKTFVNNHSLITCQTH